MSVKAGSFSVGSTGNHSVTGLTFLPTNVTFSVGARNGTTETVVQLCRGWTTASNQSFDSIYGDSTGFQSIGGTTKCITHYARVSGTLTLKVEANYVSFDTNGGGDFGFTLNFTAVDSNYTIKYIASNV